MKELKTTYKNDLNNAIDSTVNFDKLFNKTVLITGITGLIGGFIVDILLYANETLDANIEIYGLARNEQKARERFAYTNSKKLNYLFQDVCQPITLNAQIDYIIHAAGDGYPEAFRVRPVEIMTPALLGTVNTLELAREKQIKAYVYISSGEVYGAPASDNRPFKETDMIMAAGMSTRSCYPVAKQAAEILCASYALEYNVNAIVSRLSHTYGPYTTAIDNRASTQFIANASKGQDIILHSKGNQIRSYTYIADTASALLTILINGKSGEAYNIANANSTASIAEFAKTLAQIAQVNCEFEIPDEIQQKEQTPISYAVLDASKIKTLGWNGRYELIDGLKCTLENLK
ncbi:NAD-dependent epimerase/dehydratase family protein [Pseudobutyrivibrio sp. MD2005]|uniref:NAD-dependent epimerase/dehydratase family protein n=1 Tax=Pseudobutyrivibrio sp. MD2005 TaxID=1410616 RepID=UPI00055AE662|nr:NAD-dependent epimerase/dehydratase family protein [Pseudobutyrivibrio sp. MD2005]